MRGQETPHAEQPAGPYSVIRWGRSWSVEFALDEHLDHPRFDTEHEAAALAARLNAQYAARRRPTPHQPTLFGSDR